MARAEEGRAVALALAGHELGLETRRDRRVVLRLPGQGPADAPRVGGDQEGSERLYPDLRRGGQASLRSGPG